LFEIHAPEIRVTAASKTRCRQKARAECLPWSRYLKLGQQLRAGEQADHIIAGRSEHLSRRAGGLGKVHQLFGDGLVPLLDELHAVLAALLARKWFSKRFSFYLIN